MEKNLVIVNIFASPLALIISRLHCISSNYVISNSQMTVKIAINVSSYQESVNPIQTTKSRMKSFHFLKGANSWVLSSISLTKLLLRSREHEPLVDEKLSW